MNLYGIHNKKLNVYEDFVWYSSGNDLIDDLIALKEDAETAKRRKRPFALPNYLVHPDEYDMFKIAHMDERNFANPVEPCHSYKGSIDELLKKNFLDREEMRPE